jgi:hypothetical protein
MFQFLYSVLCSSGLGGALSIQSFYRKHPVAVYFCSGSGTGSGSAFRNANSIQLHSDCMKLGPLTLTHVYPGNNRRQGSPNSES